VIELSRSYPSVFGAPVIRAIDPAIFRYRYFTHCMSCTFCHDSCCSYGVDIDVENIARINALGPDFEAFVGVPRDKWFGKQRWKDHEFPGGAQGRTRVAGGACVFLDRKQRGCKIHAYALAKGIDYHEIKPLVSSLFPLTFEGGVLVVSSEIETGDLICAGEGPTLYEGVRPELAYYFSEPFVAELDALRTAQ
jgi:Fe-S-cluster containining protein